MLLLVDELRHHLALEEGDARGVACRLGEVGDGVGHAEPLQLTQPLDDDLGSPDERAGLEPVDRLLDHVGGQARPSARWARIQANRSLTSLSGSSR